MELKAQILLDTFEDARLLSRIEFAENCNELDAGRSDLTLQSTMATTTWLLMTRSCSSGSCWSTAVTCFGWSLENSYLYHETTLSTADGSESCLFVSLTYLFGSLEKILSIQLKEERRRTVESVDLAGRACDPTCSK